MPVHCVMILYIQLPETSFGLQVLLLPACPHENLRPIQARITTFGPEVQNTLVKIPIVFVLFHMFALFSCGGGGGG